MPAPGPPADPLADTGLLERLKALGAPRPWLVGPAASAPSRRELEEGMFVVEGCSVRLVPPVDWRQDAGGNRSWRYRLHTLSWLRPLLLAHATRGDSTALAIARDLALDWVRANRDDGDSGEFAWYDMAVGLRAPYLAYLLRACLTEEALAGDDAMLLVAAAERHGAELADPDNYAAGHNHGLFQDEGLYLLARQLPALPCAEEWSQLARERLRSTLDATICSAEGGHLEHSSGYQFAIAGLVSRLAEHLPEASELRVLLERLRRTAAWHVTPAGNLAQLGDTDDAPAPKWALGAAQELRGMKVLSDTGQAFVRAGDSYLAMSAGYHSAAHKHADDTGFLLVENGTVLVADPGRWSYDEHEPDRAYARSALAHNVLTVDGEDFDWRRSEPYGSGLIGAGESDGWYGIAARNPLLARHGVAHVRFLLHRPGRKLIVIDQVRASECHDYSRRLHFGPGVAAERDGDRVRLSHAAIDATLLDADPATAIELRHGEDEPSRAGWTYPSDRERAPIWTAVLRTHAKDATLALALALGDAPAERITASHAPDGALEIRHGGETLTLRLDEGSNDLRIGTARSKETA